VTIYLVRHAKAGSRHKWDGPDHLRPLTKQGRRQATAIADALERDSITRVLTSPYARCRETAAPLAERLHVELEESDAITEGTALPDTLLLIDKLAGESAAMFTHGDVIGNVLWHAQRGGVQLDDDRIEKGSMWVLRFEAGAIVAATYRPPPT
jgi:8-oxo-dGTP diphosphatase